MMKAEKIALLFPGQGSQAVGMGKGLYEAFPVVRSVYEELDDTLSQNITRLIFEGPIEDLTNTENAQPAIVAVSIATFRAMESCGFSLSQASYLVGHSLGEYAALCVGNVLSFSDTVKLLRARGRAMQKAVPIGQGGMVALVGADIDQAQNVAKKASGVGVCEVANDNCPGQVVLSGEASAMAEVPQIASDMGIKRALPLNVSAPFHSSMMQSAEIYMKSILDTVTFSDALIPIIPNVTAEAESKGDILRNLLVSQITSRVRFRESLLYLKNQDVSKMFEVGPGKILSGLVKRTLDDDLCLPINGPADVESVMAKLT